MIITDEKEIAEAKIKTKDAINVFECITDSLCAIEAYEVESKELVGVTEEEKAAMAYALSRLNDRLKILCDESSICGNTYYLYRNVFTMNSDLLIDTYALSYIMALENDVTSYINARGLFNEALSRYPDDLCKAYQLSRNKMRSKVISLAENSEIYKSTERLINERQQGNSKE